MRDEPPASPWKKSPAEHLSRPAIPQEYDARYDVRFLLLKAGTGGISARTITSKLANLLDGSVDERFELHVADCLAELVDEGILTLADGLYYKEDQSSGRTAASQAPHIGGLAEAADAAEAVASAMASLQDVWQNSATIHDPLLQATLAKHYPFPGSITAATEDTARWAQNLRRASDQMVNDPRRAATAIAEHIAEVNTNTNINRDSGETPLSIAYENIMRGGLGGICGDFAAAFNLEVAAAIADLLASIGDSDSMDRITAHAQQVAASYREARSRDDEPRTFT